ncbi:putative Ras association domain protein, partial [Trichinella nativa]
MTNLLEKFDKMLEDEAMFNHQQLLNIACSVKSRTRNVTYTRSNRDEVLHFSILGGTEKNNGIYVVKVAAGSAAERVGLKRGDQIIEVNGHNFRNIARHRALEVLRGSTHLSMVVKSNLLGFKEMLVADQCDAGALLAPVLLQQAVATSKDGSSRRRMSPVQPRRSLVQLHQLGGVDGLPMPSLRPPPRQQKHSLHLETQRAVMPALVHALANTNTTTTTTTSSRTLARLNHAGKESGGSGSRLGKLIKKLRQGSSSSALSLDADDDAVDNDHVDGHEPRVDDGGRKCSKQKIRQTLDDCDATDEAVRRATLGRPTGAQSVSMPSGVPLLGRRLKHSRSNPDLSSTANQPILPGGFGQMISQYYEPVRPQHPEHILKVYRIDQTFKYLSVYKETSAQNVVQLALQEFGMCNNNSNSGVGNDAVHSSSSSTTTTTTTANGDEWSLCEVTVTTDGLIKQRRLPAQMQNLAERISLNSRYYLKNNNCPLPLVPDELAPDLLKDAQAQLGCLHASIVAAQLTLQDFAAFASIEPAEYVANLFKLGGAPTRWPRLADFEQSVNRETFWVATEVCKERNSIRRAKIVKKFIKIA